MRRATLTAVGLLSAGVWLLGSARGQSVAPPISLVPPPTEQGAATNSVWPPMASSKASPPRAPPKNSRPPTRPSGEPSLAANNGRPSRASDKASSTPVISEPLSSSNPAVDYDGFSISTIDDRDTAGPAALPMRSRAAKASKPNVATGGVTGQESIDQEDAALKRKLTICRGCK
jgi:hypothetical protein